MEAVYSIQLYSRRHYHATGPAYCGCWHQPCPDGAEVSARLEAAGVGRYRDEDGTTRRAFFFADELSEQLDAAETVTECDAYAELLERR